MDTDFIPRSGNDAFGVIRGFVYQVDLTLERWLDLRGDARLELERGEDIDLVSRALSSEERTGEERASEFHRLLEQVKHLQRPITLRSGTARAVLSNAFEQFQANPEQSLAFRFTTTALAGLEVSSPLPEGVTGVQAWEELRRGAEGPSAETYQRGVRILLQAPVPPKGVTAPAWLRFQEFVRDAVEDEFAAFVRRFEWSTGAPGIELSSPRIQNRLVRDGYAGSPVEAKEIYDRLFVHVFHLLSRSGLKALTRTDLEHTVAQPTLAASDRRLLQTLVAVLGKVEERVGTVERELEKYNVALPGIQARLDSLAQHQGIDAAVDHTVATPDLAPPPPLAGGSARGATLELLWRVIQQHPWTALIGAATTGKTQLAVNVVRSRAGSAWWLRLRDLSVAQASLRLDKAVETLAGLRAGRSLQDWYEAMARSEGASQLLVLDDVPRFGNGDELATRLDALLVACEQSGLRLLTTGAYPIPPTYREHHPEANIEVVEVPPFTEEETRELLLARGAPPAVLTPAFIGFLRTITQNGNPALLQAMARYLSRAGWRADSALNGFVSKEYSADVDAETVHRLLDTVEDGEARDLLYRLNLIAGEFSIEQVALLADVQPPVARPRERLERLRGLWVQTESANRFSVSPLIRTLGSADLLPATLRACHLALAKEIVSRQTVNQLEGTRALIHFVSGGEYTAAAIVLLRGLDALARVEGEVWDGGMGSVWVDLPLPVEMDLALRLQVRAFQIRLRARSRKDTTYLLKDFDELLDQAGEREAWSVFSAALIVSGTLVPLNVRRAGRYVALLQRTWPQLPEQVARRMPTAEQFDPASLLWLGAADIDDESDLLGWLTNVEALDHDARVAAFATADGDRAAAYVASSFNLVEHDKPEQERDWNRALAVLEVLERRGRELDLEPIWRAAICNRISALGAGLKDLDGARAVAEAALQRSDLAARTRFGICTALAYAYVDAERVTEARTWMEAARQDAPAAPKHEAVRLLVKLSELVGSESASEALGIAEEAGAIASEAGRMTAFLDAKVFGEVAIARWLSGDRRGAFRAWERVAERVLETFPGDVEWKSLFVPFSHAAGFFFSLVGRGEQSEAIAFGDTYMPAYRGMFLDNRWDLVGARQMHKAYVYLLTAVFADAVREHARALDWATRGLVVARESSRHAASDYLIPIVEANALQESRFFDAFTLAREAGRTFVSQRSLYANGAHTTAAYDLDAVLGPRTERAWEEAEAYALNTGAVPALFQLGQLSLTDSEQYQADLHSAAAACERVAADSTHPHLWNVAASVFVMLARGASISELLAVGNSPAKPLTHAGAAVYQLGYLAASLHPEAPLSMALELQVYPAAHFHIYLGTRPPLRRIAMSFLFDYWRHRFATTRYRFSPTVIVERSIEHAAQQPESKRHASLIEAVAAALQIQIAPGTLARLRGEVS
ncbi:MAG: hypothetical protein ABW277_19755 [Longimicrobiaceae bacterium]